MIQPFLLKPGSCILKSLSITKSQTANTSMFFYCGVLLLVTHTHGYLSPTSAILLTTFHHYFTDHHNNTAMSMNPMAVLLVSLYRPLLAARLSRSQAVCSHSLLQQSPTAPEDVTLADSRTSLLSAAHAASTILP